MLKLYLARHGQDQDNANGLLNGHRDTPLTDIGFNQARQLAAKILESNLKFDHIYTSPLQRASTTAQIIAQALKMPEPEKLPMMIERDCGILSGTPIKDIAKQCAPGKIIQTETVTYFLEAPGAETFPQITARAVTFLNFIKSKHPTGSLLLVSHGDFGKMLYGAYYNLGWEHVLTKFHFGNSELILLSPETHPDNPFVFKQKQFND